MFARGFERFTALFLVVLTTNTGCTAHIAHTFEEGPAADPFEPSNVQAFVDDQFLNFFTDCDAFADSFAKSFDYNDAVRISDSKVELRETCRETEGTVNEIHTDLSIKPGTFPFPTYDYIAITGMQSVCLDIGDGNGLQPLCFDFVITEILKAWKKAPFGLKSLNWTGYYNILFESCPDFEPVDCSDGAR